MLQQIIKNQYVILHKLGGGGFGDTYLTEDTHKPSRPYCVVKELRPIAHNPQMYHLVQGMFQREAVMLENLGNSNNRIPKLYAYFSDQGKFYLVQEYIQGKTLTQMVETAGTVSETIVKEILKNLLYVLNFVHSQGIIGTFNTNVSVPPEIRGWNWGAFLLPGLWIFSNHVWIGLLCMIPVLGLPIQFLLGARGNVWAWKSRQWQSLQDFKSHQRAWAIAGGSVWGSLIGLFVLAAMVTPPEDSSTTPTLDTSITTTPTSEPFTTTPLPSLPPATTAKTQEVVIGNLQSYTDKNNLFSIDIPEGWTLTDKSQPGQTIVYWQDTTGNALAQINVFAANGTRTKQEMVEILEAFLNKVVTANTNFSKSKPVFLADGTIRITWSNEVLIKGEKIRMTGNSYVEQHGDKLALYTIVVPSEQYAKLLPSIQQINASYKINASAPLPR